MSLAEARAARSGLAWRGQAIGGLRGAGSRHAALPTLPLPLAAVQAAPAWLLLGAPAVADLARAMGAARAAAPLRGSLDGTALSAFAAAAGEELADWALTVAAEADVPDVRSEADGVAAGPPTAAGLEQAGRALLAALLAGQPETRALVPLMRATPAPAGARGHAARLLQLALARAGTEGG